MVNCEGYNMIRCVSATGSKTTLYNVQENGDPNQGVDKDYKGPTETQYLIKWKGWSHIHNTWESENTLREQKVNGLKKLENFIRREEELSEWWVVEVVWQKYVVEMYL